MSSGAHNKQVICKRTLKYSIFQITCFNIVQGCKNLVAHSHCAIKKFGQKKTLNLGYKMAACLIFTSAVSVLHDVG